MLLLTSLLLFPAPPAAGHGDKDAGVGIGWVRPLSPVGITGRHVDYVVGDDTYEGYLALPAAGSNLSKAVLIGHQHMGLGEYEYGRAEEMAGMGYVAFALDAYGKGVRAKSPGDGFRLMNQALSNITKLRKVINGGVQQLLRNAQTTRPFAMGYCFGGQMVLELARHPEKGASEGVTFAAVSSMHGVLAPFSGEKATRGEVKTWIQVHHADLDDQSPGLPDIESELRNATDGTDAVWEGIRYAKCVHGWTEVGGNRYNARAAVQAHKSTFEFFEMALGVEDPKKDAFPLSPFCRQQASKRQADLQV